MKKLASKLFSLCTNKKPLNYPYFLILLICISSFSYIRFLSLDREAQNIPSLFLFYSFGQGFLEIAIFIFLSILLKSYVPRWIYFLLVTCFTALLLIHFTNFTMLHLLDSPLSSFLNFFVGHGISHIISVFQAINMNKFIMILSFVVILAIPIIGITIYELTNHIVKKIQWRISLLQITAFIALTFIGLILFEQTMMTKLTYESHTKYRKTLPLGMTLFTPHVPKFHLPRPIAKPRDQSEILKKFPKLIMQSKPNIYLFVIETFRKDFITEQIAPSLTAFAKENLEFPHSYSNANSTHPSWFAIFYSMFPYHWTQLRNVWSEGSVPLQILKNIGYKIRIYSSADLNYFEMDKMIFGYDRHLADQIEEYALDRTIESWQRDALALRSFEKDICTREGREGNLFLFFLDATHSEYSFPNEFAGKFTPITKQINYLTINRDSIEPIKNRYRNSISYVDSLMDRFFSTLKQARLYDEAIIAITGDHGEEFFEEGSLFHGTHLNQEQTSVPLFFKFQNSHPPVLAKVATHIDIFPSILHFITKDNQSADCFDGQSIFSENRWPYHLTVLQNGAKTPCEFTIENEKHKIRARFINTEDLYNQNSLEILSLNTTDNIENKDLKTIIHDHFPSVFTPLIDR